ACGPRILLKFAEGNTIPPAWCIPGIARIAAISIYILYGYFSSGNDLVIAHNVTDPMIRQLILNLRAAVHITGRRTYVFRRGNEVYRMNSSLLNDWLATTSLCLVSVHYHRNGE